MKMTNRVIVAACALLLSFVQVNAQQKTGSRQSRWISEKGFWVIQGNIKQPRQNIISFYTNEGTQVYRETVNEKVKLKRKTLVRLKSILDTAVIAWERNKPLRENENLFVAAKRK